MYHVQSRLSKAFFFSGKDIMQSCILSYSIARRSFIERFGSNAQKFRKKPYDLPNDKFRYHHEQCVMTHFIFEFLQITKAESMGDHIFVFSHIWNGIIYHSLSYQRVMSSYIT